MSDEGDKDGGQWSPPGLPPYAVMQAAGWRVVDEDYTADLSFLHSTMDRAWPYPWVLAAQQRLKSYPSLEAKMRALIMGLDGPPGCEESSERPDSEASDKAARMRPRHILQTVPVHTRSSSPRDSASVSDTTESDITAISNFPQVPLATELWGNILALNPDPIHKTLWESTLGFNDKSQSMDVDSLIKSLKKRYMAQEEATSPNDAERLSYPASTEPTPEHQAIWGHILKLMISLKWFLDRLIFFDKASPMARMAVFIFENERIPLWGNPIDALPTPGHVAMFTQFGAPALPSDIQYSLFENAVMERGIPNYR